LEEKRREDGGEEVKSESTFRSPDSILKNIMERQRGEFEEKKEVFKR